jgi:hypothetical protein
MRGTGVKLKGGLCVEKGLNVEERPFRAALTAEKMVGLQPLWS